jgi:hypothetical protein
MEVSCCAGMLLMSLLLLLIQLPQQCRMPLKMSDPLAMMSEHFLEVLMYFKEKTKIKIQLL